MSLADLEQLRLSLPGCEATVLADVGAGTVLGVSSALHLPQEHYDGLTRQAKAALSCGDGASAFAILAGPRGLRLYLRAPDHPEEVLGVVLPPRADVQAAMAKACAALAGVPLPNGGP